MTFFQSTTDGCAIPSVNKAIRHEMNENIHLLALTVASTSPNKKYLTDFKNTLKDNFMLSTRSKPAEIRHPVLNKSIAFGGFVYIRNKKCV